MQQDPARRSMLLVLLILGGPWLAAAAAPPAATRQATGGGTYASAKTCGACHDVMFKAWSESPHARSASSPAYLEALYGADRSAFDQAIGSDARYAAGWKDIAARERFGDLKRRADDRLGLSRGFETGLWINHVVGALDALRAARVRRIRLYPGVDLKADGTLRRGRPQLVFALERRF